MFLDLLIGDTPMNRISRNQQKMLSVIVMIAGSGFFFNEAVFAQPLYQVKGNSVDKATFNG